ncbi:RNA polymerase subunit sigma-24 [Paenibacillus sp. NPDC058174]|uniref:RNA polymerase subunit sigma-24 n=1 Tax=Paenibacillus sp. NPDC058174 TaxID=3346366 RepID=UPI0036D87BD5
MNMEQDVVEQLKAYKRLVARKKWIEKQPVGSGVTISSVYEDDKLQELHRELRRMPSYMYLNKREQQLEQAAHAHLTQHPVGTKAQLREVKQAAGNAEPGDEKLLRELARKIEKVIEARAGSAAEGYEGVINRLSELQDIERQLQSIDQAMEALQTCFPEYERLLRLRYIEGRPADFVASELGIVDRTFRRWRQKASLELVRFLSE